MEINTFKGLDLIDRVPEGQWTEVHDIAREAVIKTIHKKKKCKKAKRLSEETLEIAEKRREVEHKGEKERYIHLDAEVQRIERRDLKKPSSMINVNKSRKIIEQERLDISLRKLEIPREHFMQRWAR